MAIELDKVSARDALKPRREPYWIRLDRGCSLGFRKMSTTSIGSWIARYRDAETGERPKHPLGEFGDLPPKDRYGAAKKAAEEWFAHMGRGGSSQPITVKTACENYVTHMRANKGDAPADDLHARMKRWIFEEGIAKVPLQKLTRTQVQSWRNKLAITPVVENPHAQQHEQRTRKRSESSLNREMTGLRAALNHAMDMGQVTTDLPWKQALKPVKDATRSRDAYLTREQRRALIEAAPDDFANFIKALCLVPLRPGALAALTAGRLDGMLGVLAVGKDKANRDRKIMLPASTAAFFRELSKDRPLSAPLLTQANGAHWDRHVWKKVLAEVISVVNEQDKELPAHSRVKLPEGLVVLTLRHSVITDLVVGGLDLFTVAKLSGTSVAMIEKHYGHLQHNIASEGLAKLAL